MDDTLLRRWYELKRQVADFAPIIAEERQLREQVFRQYFPIPKEGSDKIDLPDGYHLNAKLQYSYNVDEAALAAAANALREGGIPVDELFHYSPKLQLRPYRALSPEQRQVIDRFLVIKPQLPQLEIKA